MMPTILTETTSEFPAFSTRDENPQVATYAIPGLAAPPSHRRFSDSVTMIYCAVYAGGKWVVRPMGYSSGNSHVSLLCTSDDIVKVAYPIDPAMTREDIEGATEIEPNSDNTGWLFFHGDKGKHHDHLLTVQSATIALFQPYLDQIDVKWKQAIAIPATAGPLVTRYANLCEYRDDVIAAALEAEKKQLHGHFVRNEHPEVGHVHAAIKAGLSATKLKWGASQSLLTKYTTISREHEAVTLQLATPHEPETRWARVARIEAEKKAKEAEQGD